MQRYVISLAGLRIQFYFRNEHTWYYFRSYYCGDGKSERFDGIDIIVPPVEKKRLDEEIARLDGDEPYAEYSLLIEPLSNLLLRRERFLFHGVAFLWHEKAFLITGKSGIGKSTQLKNWMKLYPDEIEIINGDKPVIERRGEEFIVHPSPWTGKENWGGEKSATLAGIISLERSSEDRIRRLRPQEAVFPMFLQFLYLPTDYESVDLVCSYEEQMLDRVPIWKLSNIGTEHSARLTHQTLCEEGF